MRRTVAIRIGLYGDGNQIVQQLAIPVTDDDWIQHWNLGGAYPVSSVTVAREAIRIPDPTVVAKRLEAAAQRFNAARERWRSYHPAEASAVAAIAGHEYLKAKAELNEAIRDAGEPPGVPGTGQ